LKVFTGAEVFVEVLRAGEAIFETDIIPVNLLHAFTEIQTLLPQVYQSVFGYDRFASVTALL